MATREQSSERFPRKFGNYHLLAPLAQGGMGALYLATSGGRGLERLLVIKKVLPHLADSEYVARFRDEAKVVVKLSHSNLVPVFDAGMVGDELFLAMDFVEGKDLRAVWNRCAKRAVAFPMDIAVYIVKELCRGLGYAHSFANLELVHRDVSPPNALISYSGEVKLTDFGLASSTLKREKTAPGIVYGKVAYMSPEQARGEKLDGRSDLYAAGIILWELLTGRQLFPPGKEQPQDLLKRARNPRITAPSKRAQRVPPELDAICLTALAPDPAARYSSGEVFRQALARWLAAAAPETDAATMGDFVVELFGDEIAQERAGRAALIHQIRDRARTLPPTDELRRIVEASDELQRAGSAESAAAGRPESAAADEAPQRPERGGGADKRDRARGVAVKVPEPGPEGRTVITSAHPSSSAAAAVAEPEAEGAALIGQVIDGRYRINELIGEGGMGRVFLAEHIDIGKRVAIKILHPVYGTMPELVERFRREARAASKIGHPHIVDVTDSGTTGEGSFYFVMEHLEGVELASVIDREGALDVARSLRIATQICRALSAAHAASIVHRDLKPENVFLTLGEGTSDFVKVLDFGIAKSTEAEQTRGKRLTSPGMAMGTPEYMAPEQAAGRPADARTDIYSVGAILYEMLTGVAPYDGDNFMEILTKKATADPPRAKTLRPDLPEVVDELVARAMSRSPAARPSSMDALEYELTKCLAGRGAAVAKILGVSADTAFVASLNPGIDLKSDRPPMGGDAADTERDVAAASAHSVEAVISLFQQAVEASLPPGQTSSPPEPTAAVRRRALLQPRRLGATIGLGLAVLAAGLLLALTGVGGDKTPPEAVPAAATPAGQVPPPVRPGARLEAGAAAQDSAAEVQQGSEAADEDVGGESGSEARAGSRGSAAERARSRREARRLLRQAKGFESQMKWSRARGLYRRVASGKHHRAQGLLGLAQVAFETKNTDEAITYAEEALRAGAGNPARMTLGNAYMKKGRYEKALQYYEQVLKADPGDQAAQVAAQAARRRLGRPP